MVRARSLVMVVLAWLAWANIGHAVVVEGLYRVEVTVDDRAVAARQAALPQAFALVLQRASGRVVDAPALSADDIARGYLKGFRYETNDNGELALVASFSRSAVNEFLAERRLPVFGDHRPDVLVWLGVEHEGARRWVSDGEFASLTQSAFEDFALPLVLPTGDLEDSLALPVGRLFGLFRDDIRNASERYGAESMVAARLMPFGDGWRLDGYIEYAGDSQQFSAMTETPAEGVAELARAVAGYFSGRFGIVAVDEATLAGARLLEVRGIQGYADYQELLALVRSVSGVRDVDVQSVRSDLLTLAVRVAADWQQVVANLRLDRRIADEEGTDTLIWKP